MEVLPVLCQLQPSMNEGSQFEAKELQACFCEVLQPPNYASPHHFTTSAGPAHQ